MGTSIRELESDAIRTDILGYVKRSGKLGATDKDIERELGSIITTGRMRDHRRYLVEGGLLFDSGKRRFSAGCRTRSIVWLVAKHMPGYQIGKHLKKVLNRKSRVRVVLSRLQHHRDKTQYGNPKFRSIPESEINEWITLLKTGKRA